MTRSFRVQAQDKSKALEYYRTLAGRYDEFAGRGPFQFLRVRERTAVSELASPAFGRSAMIDVGCGSGFYSMLAKEKGMHVTAVDAVPEMLAPLRDRVDEVHASDIESLSLPRQFGLVVCAGVLDFVLDPELAFRNLCALVEPEGRLVILVPRTGLGGLIYRFEKKMEKISVNLFDPTWFSTRAQAQGLTLVDRRYPIFTNMALAFERRDQEAPSRA